jgi:hypothetical protein
VSLPVRVAALLVAFAAVVAGLVFVVVYYLLGGPPVIDDTAGVTPNSGGSVHLVLQEDPQNDSSSKPDWVSYFVQDPKTSKWVHTTLFKVPAGTRVNVTILGYDGCTPPRNNFWTQVQGTMGGTVTVQQFKDTGKPLGPVQTTSTINGWAHCAVGHTFAIPSLNLYVPVGSPNASAELCSESPCTSGPYTAESFSFMTPRHAGTFRWQCLVPCGGGFLDGNAGPMQTFGYMTGNMEVTG